MIRIEDLRLLSYIFTFYHYIITLTNYVVKIAYLTLYIYLNFKDKIFKLFIF